MKRWFWSILMGVTVVAASLLTLAVVFKYGNYLGMYLR